MGLNTEWHGANSLLFALRDHRRYLDSPFIGGGIRNGAGYLTRTSTNTTQNADRVRCRLGNRAVFKRLGYLIEVTNQEFPDVIAALSGASLHRHLRT